MNFLLSHLVISLLFTAATSFFIGLFVLSRSKQNFTNKIFSLYSFSIAGWSLFESLMVSADTYSLGFFYSKAMNFFIPFISVFFLHFTLLFLKLKREWLLRINYCLSAIFALLSAFGARTLSGGVGPSAFVNFYTEPGGLVYYFYLTQFVIVIVYALFLLFVKYFSSKDVKKRNQLAYLVWPSLLGYIGGGANWFFVFKINIPVLMPFGTYLVGLYVFAVAYAILKYQLMDIRIVVKKAFLYSVGIAVVSGLVVGVSFLSGWFNKNIYGFNSWIVPLIAGFAAFIIGNIFWRKSKEVERLKYEFVTVAAHKLRTPLTRIKWGIEALSDKVDKTGKSLLADIGKSNAQIIALTDELLSVSKTKVSQYEYKIKPDNLDKIVARVINDFQMQIAQKGIKLSYSCEKNLPKVKIDKMRISSVVQVLLENAILYTKDEIKITIDVYKNNVIFHIEDNGIGISKQDQPYIFSRFYRTHEAYLTETEGSGIGLFLAKSIIDKHNGKIGVRSEGKGKGSAFWFSLKIAK